VPTDLTRAIASRRTRERRALAGNWLVLGAIAVLGVGFTIVRAIQSESVEAALALLATMD
jgi:hypothetical protein